MHLLLASESIQLFPDGTMFLHIALILGMIWLLNRTLYKPINRVLEAREKSKGGNVGEAAEILGRVEEKELRYTRELLDARTQGYELFEKQKKNATGAREKKLAEAKAATAEKFESERAQLESESAAARDEIGAGAEQMADQIAASILKG